MMETSFPSILTDYDLYIFGEGNHHHIYEKLGAHSRTVNGVSGVNFAVWAPNAERVSVVGDFNQWDGRKDQMHPLGQSGVWEIFIPECKAGELYKYEIKTKQGNLLVKVDPYAFWCEVPPKTASIVWDISGYDWKDAEWMCQRDSVNPLNKPISIYEVHLGSWMRVSEDNNRPLTYRELADSISEYVVKMGFTHVELLPIATYPYDPSWGYQITGYFAPQAKFGTPQDFMYFVDTCHQHNIGVILDWVPGHFPKNDYSLSQFDGTHLYEHADPRKGEHKEWDTLVFNYGRNEVSNFLLSNAVYWIENYHLDGLRVDAVASMLYLDYSRKEGEWIPNKWGGRENLEAIDFIKKLNEIVYSYYPGVSMIAEESTAWPMVSRPTYLGGLGFGLKWNMGWMHDTLQYFSKDPIHRKHHHELLTFSLLYAFSENFILPLSHDEVVHGKASLLSKMPGDFWQKFANLRALYSYMLGHPGKKLLFMGSEFGQWREWDHNQSLDWHLLEYEPHRGLQRFIQDWNRLYRSQPALYSVDFHWSGFEWIDFRDTDDSIVSFLRKSKDERDILVFVCNFTPVPRHGYRIGVPFSGVYREVLNSDSGIYWGGNMGNFGGVRAEDRPWHGKPFSISLTLPPLSVVILKPEISSETATEGSV
ncbi:MAG: 1,4-alpha-glucan branching protein GlgB [Dehalococcoidales bacterium]|nr:1,4-alpha-glucan branching protein GlgB [Dehalococcoidales bacterium]